MTQRSVRCQRFFGLCRGSEEQKVSLVCFQEKKRKVKRRRNEHHGEKDSSPLLLLPSLCEDEARLVVNLEDFLDGVDVRRRPQVQTQVVLLGRSHDLLQEGRGGWRRSLISRSGAAE